VVQAAGAAVGSARRFVWRLTAKNQARVPVSRFDEIPEFDPDDHRKHARRNVSPDELALVLNALAERVLIEVVWAGRGRPAGRPAPDRLTAGHQPNVDRPRPITGRAPRP
jgi:hypothetical protein